MLTDPPHPKTLLSSFPVPSGIKTIGIYSKSIPKLIIFYIIDSTLQSPSVTITLTDLTF